MNDLNCLDSGDLSGRNTIIHLPRSRLYNLEPLGLENVYPESLTSYINRLAWTYGVSPRILVAQEILPHLGNSYHFRSSFNLLGAFCREEAMSINGAGGTALDWASTLTQLTTREDLRDLTLCSLARDMPLQGLLREAPAWCPACYQEWRQQGQSIYQPLLWMLRVITVCQRHWRKLEGRCPCCQEKQSVIAARMQPGCCTQCMAWLGRSPNSEIEEEIDDETRSWQQWVLAILDELRGEATATGSLPWEHFSTGLAVCAEIAGSAKRLASLVGVSKQLLSSWLNQKQKPTFERTLVLCYALNISPLLLLANSPDRLKEAFETREIHQPLHLRHFALRKVNRERAFELIQAVLNGHHTPLGVRELERRLGLGARTLIYHFPDECALITSQYQAYRAEQARQRAEQRGNEVYRATLTLNARGTNPSAQRVASILSDPGVMRTREGLTAWHNARRELELEP